LVEVALGVAVVLAVVAVAVVKGIPNYKDSNKSALDKDSKSTSGHDALLPLY